jgi:phosphohistidine phosphatase
MIVSIRIAKESGMSQGRLLLMRHAKSDRSDPAARDFERPLTRRGRNAVAPMAKWLKKRDFTPARILSSPAVRARETALLLARELGMKKSDIAWDEAIYEADLAALLRVIRGCGEETLLLVGHNPGFDDLLCHLCGEPPPRDDAGKLLTTAAIAVLDFDGAIDARAGSARLVALKRPRDSG